MSTRWLLLAALVLLPRPCSAWSLTSDCDPAQGNAVGWKAATGWGCVAIPQACGTVPSSDTLNGSIGSGSCYTRSTDTRPTVVQAAIVTADATGAWSVTWSKPFTSSSPYINPQAVNPAGTQPYICNVAASTTTTAAGKCWQTTTMTLPTLATSLLGLVLNPTGAAASIQVRVAARDTTQ